MRRHPEILSSQARICAFSFKDGLRSETKPESAPDNEEVGRRMIRDKYADDFIYYQFGQSRPTDPDSVGQNFGNWQTARLEACGNDQRRGIVGTMNLSDIGVRLSERIRATGRDNEQEANELNKQAAVVFNAIVEGPSTS